MIYLNEKFLATNEAYISVNDRGLLLGDGVFETLLAIKGKVLFLAEHWERLLKGLKILDISTSITYEKLQNIINQLLVLNRLQETNVCIRITITRGESTRGLIPTTILIPTLLVTAAKWTDEKPDDYRLVFSSIVRNEKSPLSQIKSTNYLDNILARQEAIKKQADDAILLNTQGYVAETTCANLFVIKDNCIYTPPTSDGALPGIIRQKVIETCKKKQCSFY